MTLIKNIFLLTTFLLTTLFFSFSAHSAQPRFMGYYANQDINGNHDHTNITHIWAGFADKNTATAVILSQLSQAKQKGIKAIVAVESFVFNNGTTGSTSCPFRLESNAATYWDNFVNELVSHGYLVPNNPDASTVAAFYPVDEPDLCGLRDSGGQAHPALKNAIDTIRNHSMTRNFPLAVLLSKKYGRSIQGVRLYDWAGLDYYSINTSKYLSQFSVFQSKLNPNQKSILVPQASYGGSLMRSYGAWHNPEAILTRFLQDPKVIGIMPFLWSHPDTSGTRDIPELRSAYTAIGKHIKNGTPLPLKVTIYCINGGGGFFECGSNVERGTLPYSYSWSNGGSSPSTFYHIQCGFPFDVELNVVDSNGTQISSNKTLNCVPGTDPR